MFGRIMKKKGSVSFAARMLCIVLVLTTLAGCRGKGDGARQGESGTTPTGNSVTESVAMPGVTTPTIATPTITGEIAPTEKEQEDVITELLSQMTLEEKVGQMMVVSFRVWQDLSGTAAEAGSTVESREPAAKSARVNVTELNDALREFIREYHFGGTILFAENIKDAEQTLRLVMDLQAANQQGGGIPYFVAIDQEGGSITRINFATTGVGNMALAATADAENATKMAQIYGTELQALGINMDYAPVLDINNNPRNPIIGVRSFSDSPQIVSEFGEAYLSGLKSTGTIATLKHFRGTATRARTVTRDSPVSIRPTRNLRHLR